MKYRVLGKTGYKVSEISFGAWAIGGTWGSVDDSTSMKALEKALEEELTSLTPPMFTVTVEVRSCFLSFLKVQRKAFI